MVHRRVLRYYRAFWAPTAAGLLLTLCGIGLNLLKPWPFKLIVDRLLTAPVPAAGGVELPGFGATSVEQALLVLCVALILIQISWGVTNWISSYLFVKAGLQALLKLRTELYAYLQSLSLRYHDARRSTDSTFRVAYDSQSIQTIYNKGFTNIFSSGVMLIGTFAVMITIDWQLTLLSMAVLPLILFAIYYFARRIREQSTAIQERESAVLTQAQEGLSAVRMVHAFGREEWEVQQFQARADLSLRANLQLTLTNVNSALVISTLMVLGTAALYYVGSLHVVQGTLTLGSLLVFSAYLLMLYQPLESITYTAWAMEGAAAGAQRCFEVLDRQDDVADAPDAVALAGTSGALAFHNVTFSYGDKERLVLDDVTLSIEPGQVIGIVGGTGAGKSTLLSLVPRFYDPTQGKVTLDGRDLRHLQKRSLRAHIGIVLQETLLFSTTVRENIAYGRPDATEADIRAAAERAQAHEFIRQLPLGYDSPVGERGGHLSVGQRQRIGIARAFLKDAPLLLLDEPTSALDPATEAAIMETIRDLMRGRTTLLVTHRLGTVHRADTIVVLENGRVVETGAGEDLLARGGTYTRLYTAGRSPREAVAP